MPCIDCGGPTLNPTGERQGSNHFAIRFDDHKCRLTLDGEEVKHCVEVVTGPGGWGLYEDLFSYSTVEWCSCGSRQALRRWIEHHDGYVVEPRK
jgi:hypothetical protein